MCITNDILDVIFPFKMTSVILGKSEDYRGNCTLHWSVSALLEQIESWSFLADFWCRSTEFLFTVTLRHIIYSIVIFSSGLDD